MSDNEKKEKQTSDTSGKKEEAPKPSPELKEKSWKLAPRTGQRHANPFRRNDKTS